MDLGVTSIQNQFFHRHRKTIDERKRRKKLMEIFCQKADVLKIKQHSNVTNNSNNHPDSFCSSMCYHSTEKVVCDN